VTLHRATGEGESTTVGSGNMFMAYSHVGHNASVGSSVMLSNCVAIAGHAQVEDCAVLGGYVGVHQFTRVGTMAMLGAYSGARVDVPPYVLSEGVPARALKLNTVALRRRGVSAEAITALRAAFRILYRSGLNTSEALVQVRAEVELLPEVEHLVTFLEAVGQGHRGRALN
jgi:UDP-N-acetylglucosamine acyltransferase